MNSTPTPSPSTLPTVHLVDRTEAGSCNSCQDYTTDKVLLITLKTTSFRLCKECATQLMKQLTIHTK